MKKKIMYGTLGAIVLSAGLYFTLSFNETEMVEAKPEEEAKGVIKLGNTSFDTPGMDPKLIEISLEEGWLAMEMGYMALQKVNIGEEDYTYIPKGLDSNSIPRVQMTKENIDHLKQKLETVEVTKNIVVEGYDYESILNRWSEGNFEKVAEETEILLGLAFNYSGDYEGQPASKKDEAGEQEYIQHFFGDEGMKLHEEQ